MKIIVLKIGKQEFVIDFNTTTANINQPNVYIPISVLQDTELRRRPAVWQKDAVTAEGSVMQAFSKISAIAVIALSSF